MEVNLEVSFAESVVATRLCLWCLFKDEEPFEIGRNPAEATQVFQITPPLEVLLSAGKANSEQYSYAEWLRRVSHIDLFIHSDSSYQT